MENIIYIELKRRGFNVDVGVIEIKENEKYYIHSSFNIDDYDKKDQELRPLRNVNDFFKKIIVVKDDIVKYKNEEGILIVGIFDFLLDTDCLN